MENSYIFHISAQNIDCGYSLEPLIVFLSYRNDFLGTQKRIRFSHGKRVIGRIIKFYFTKLNIDIIQHFNGFNLI